MSDYLIRQATLNDIDFLVESIIEAEKAGTNILSYTTLFGLSETEAKTYIAKMLEEEVEGCDFALSGFLLAEKNGEPVAALSAWVEGIDGISSVIIKGNLLNYYLPKESIERAKKFNYLFSELAINEFITGSYWLGYAYVKPKYRGRLLLVMLYHQHIKNLKMIHPEIKEVYCQIFSNNIVSILNFKLLKFNVIKNYEAKSPEIIEYLPSSSKLVMHKLI